MPYIGAREDSMGERESNLRVQGTNSKVVHLAGESKLPGMFTMACNGRTQNGMIVSDDTPVTCKRCRTIDPDPTIKFRAQVRSVINNEWVDGGLFTKRSHAEQDAARLGALYGATTRVIHEGPVSVRTTDYGRVLVLCPCGHLVQSVESVSYGGSIWEDRVGRGYSVQCEGAIA